MYKDVYDKWNSLSKVIETRNILGYFGNPKHLNIAWQKIAWQKRREIGDETDWGEDCSWCITHYVSNSQWSRVMQYVQLDLNYTSIILVSVWKRRQGCQNWSLKTFFKNFPVVPKDGDVEVLSWSNRGRNWFKESKVVKINMPQWSHYSGWVRLYYSNK